MPTPPRAAGILAVLLPLVVLGAGFGWLGAPREVELSADAKVYDRRLASAKQPAVVIVGNSKARTDLDPAAIAAAWKVRPQQVVALDVAASTAPAWYAVLENRVYGGGYEPPLVVVYGPLGMMLDTQVYGAVQRMRLEEQMGPTEPVLGPKVLGRSGGATFLDRARERRTEVHQALLDGLKGLSVLAFGPPAALPPPDGAPGPRPAGPKPRRDGAKGGDEAPPPSPLERAIQDADPALERLFGMEGQVESRQRVIPVAEATGPLIASTGGTAEGSLLGDFVDLAEAHGSRIVFVRAPVAPSERGNDAVPATDVRATVDLLNARGAGWIDLSTATLPDGAFRDALHLNKRGRDALTAQLLAQLDAVGARGSGAMSPAARPLAVNAPTRVGAGPPLPALAPTRTDSTCGYAAKVPDLQAIGAPRLVAAGLAGLTPVRVYQDGAPLAGPAGREDFADRCGGAFAHFLAEVRFSPTDSVDAPHTYTVGLAPDLPLRGPKGDEAWWVYPSTRVRWTLPEAVEALLVEAWIQVFGPGSVAVRLAGEEVRLDGEGPHRVRLASAVVPGDGVEIAADLPGKPAWAAITGLSLAAGEASPAWLVGAAPAPVRLLEGKVEYAAAPPAVTTGALGPGEGGARALPVPGWGALDDPSTARRLGVLDCSPLIPTADGQRLTAAHTEVDRVVRLGGGRFAHVGGALLVGPPNDLAPPADGHAWGAILDPKRRCEGGRWVYPGDIATVYGPGDALRGLAGGADTFTLAATAFPGATTHPDGTLHLTLTAGDRVVLDEEVAADVLTGAPLTWTIDPPLPPRAPRVTLTLESSRRGPAVLVANAALSEPALPLAPGSAP